MKTLHNNSSIPDWQSLAEALREELRECAWLLRLMEEQQKHLLSRDSAGILETNAQIDDQLALFEEKRRYRDSLQASWAIARSLPTPQNLSNLLPELPSVARPLFEALQREGEGLLEKIQRRGRQNHLILSRANDFAGLMLQTLRPEVKRAATYNQRGRFSRVKTLPGAVIRAAV
jgi:flagellar biosynthesis/type III secretory pathway chaperone